MCDTVHVYLVYMCMLDFVAYMYNGNTNTTCTYSDIKICNTCNYVHTCTCMMYNIMHVMCESTGDCGTDSVNSSSFTISPHVPELEAITVIEDSHTGMCIYFWS